jgi:hypothetical protein
MSRLTLRLPESLHQQLSDLAKSEGVSLNQYIVYILTRQVAANYTVQANSESSVQEQRESFANLLKSLGEANPLEVQETLAQRELVDPECKLTSDIFERVKNKIQSLS